MTQTRSSADADKSHLEVNQGPLQRGR